MSYHQGHTHHQTVRGYVPHYQVRSDYLPTRVHEANNAQTAEWLRRYEEERRRGRVFTQKPAEFNPNRYVSYVTYENVQVDRPMNEEHFSRVVRR